MSTFISACEEKKLMFLSPLQNEDQGPLKMIPIQNMKVCSDPSGFRVFSMLVFHERLAQQRLAQKARFTTIRLGKKKTHSTNSLLMISDSVVLEDMRLPHKLTACLPAEK